MNKKFVSLCLAMGLVLSIGAALPVSASGGYDIQVKFLKTDLTPKTPLMPKVVIKKGTGGDSIGGMNTPNGIVDFNLTYDFDVYSTFSSKTKKGDKFYVNMVADNATYNIYSLDKAGADLTDTNTSNWFSVGDLHCLAFDFGKDGRCTLNKAETLKMERERVALLDKAKNYSIKVYSDGQMLPLTIEPVIIDGTTYLPMRDIANLCDLDVIYSDTDTDVSKKYGEGKNPVATVKVKGLDTAIHFPVNGNGYYSVGADKKESLQNGTSAKVVDGQTLLPARKLVELAGLNIQWDAAQKRIDIETTNE